MTEHEVASKYAPVYYLHPEEKYYPSKVEDYFLNSKVKLIYDKNHKSSDYILGAKDISFGGQTIYAGSEYCIYPKIECISMKKYIISRLKEKIFKKQKRLF